MRVADKHRVALFYAWESAAEGSELHDALNAFATRHGSTIKAERDGGQSSVHARARLSLSLPEGGE